MSERAQDQALTPRPRVVIVGSGFAALFAAKRLRRVPVDITMISRTSYHLFQPLLYQVATGILSTGEVAPATRDILRRQRNVRVLLGDVQRIDVQRREVVSQAPVGSTVTPYDHLILAAGAGQSYFGNDHFATFAPGMKTIDDALELRGRIYGAFEMAELLTDPAEVQAWLTFVVVGGGPTGVEMAGQIAELAHRALRRDFRSIDPGQARIVLVDALPAVLTGFGERLGTQAQRHLHRLGVEVQLDTRVVDVAADCVRVSDPDGTQRHIPTHCTVWAAGVSASPLGRQVAEQTGASVDRNGRVHVQPDLTMPGHPEIFVVGDMMALDDLPGVAQVAMQGGRYAADQIARQIRGREPAAPFRYFDKGSMATVSRFYAVAMIGPLRLAGFAAWLLWLAIHLLYLVGFKNRITTLLHWTVTFIGRARSERTATEQQVFARTALAELDRRRTPAHDAAPRSAG